jgi:Family of unknown function (DUF6212)
MSKMSDEAMILEKPKSLACLFDLKPNLLKSLVVLCAGEITGEVKDLVPDSFFIWRIVEAGSHWLKIDMGHGENAVLSRPPLLTVALITADDNASLMLAKRASDWLQARGARSVPEPIVATSSNPTGIATEVAAQLSKLLITDAEFITMLSRELASLRISNESLQNNFAALESYLGRKGLQPFDLAFVNEPVNGDSRASVLNEAAQARVMQVLPVGSAGVSAVGVHLTKIPSQRQSNAIFRVGLTTLEDSIVVDSWSVPVSALREGWNVFGLTRSLSGPPRTLELTISATGTEGEFPLLSLGASQPLQRFQVKDAETHRPIAKVSLALQVWTGLAAVALPSWAAYWSSRSRGGDSRGSALHEEAIAPHVLQLARHHNPDEVKFDFEVVQVLIPERAVACHPPATGTAIGRLPGACHAGAVRVSASVFIDNPKAQDVEFALVITVDGARVRPLLFGETELAAGEGCSGWVRVPANAKKAVNAFVQNAVAHWQDIFIVTRMAQEGNNNFAWAKFQGLTVVFQDLA